MRQLSREPPQAGLLAEIEARVDEDERGFARVLDLHQQLAAGGGNIASAQALDERSSLG